MRGGGARNTVPVLPSRISGGRAGLQSSEDLFVLFLYLVHARHDHLSRSLIGHVIHHPRHHVPRQPRKPLAPLFGQILSSKDHPANDCCRNRHGLSCARLHVRFLLVPTLENLNQYQSQKKTAPSTMGRLAVSRDTRSFVRSAYRLAYSVEALTTLLLPRAGVQKHPAPAWLRLAVGSFLGTMIEGSRRSSGTRSPN